MFNLLAKLLLLTAFSTCSFAQSSEKHFIYLIDAIDGEGVHCFDLSGFGDNLRLENPVQTHTCKQTEEAADQFVFNFEGDQLKVVGHDRCVQVSGSGSSTLPGSPVLARACTDSALQKLSLEEDGKVRVAETDLCLSAGTVAGPARGGHYWRTLTLVNCSNASPELSRWQVGNPNE